MPQTIRIKRSTGSSAPSTLAQGELAYSKGSATFYIGDPAAADTPIAIGPAIINDAGTASLVSGITAAEIRSLIGVDPSGTDNSTPVTLTGTPDYLTIAGQTITLNQIDASTDISGLDSEVRGAVSAQDNGGFGSFAYTPASGQFTYQGVTTTEIRAQFSAGTGVGIAAGVISIGQAVGVTDNVTFGDVVVNGDLTVNGTTTTLNTAELDVEDNIIRVNSNVTGAPTLNAGIEVERGTSDNVSIRYNETTDVWELTNDGTTFDTIATSATAGGVGDVSTNAGLGSLSGQTGSVSINLALSELTDMTAALVGTDEFIVLDAGAQRRKAANEIGLTAFNNDAGFVTSAGVTALTAGSLIDVSGTTNVTVNVDLSELVDMTQTFVGTDELVVLDSGNQRRKAANEIPLSAFNNDAGFTSNNGDITSIQVQSSDGSISGTGTTNSGAAVFDLEVAVVDGGTY